MMNYLGAIEARVADQKKRDDELTTLRERVTEMEGRYANYDETIKDLVKRYAEKCRQTALLTLEVQRMREALETLGNNLGEHAGGMPIQPMADALTEYANDAFAAISTPLDTSALDAYVTEKVEQGKKEVFEDLAQQAEIMELTPDAIRYMAEAIAAQEGK